jgi:hypothetical protein
VQNLCIFQSTGFLSVVVWKEWRHYITLWNAISFGKLMHSFHTLHFFGRRKEMAQKNA